MTPNPDLPRPPPPAPPPASPGYCARCTGSSGTDLVRALAQISSAGRPRGVPAAIATMEAGGAQSHFWEVNSGGWGGPVVSIGRLGGGITSGSVSPWVGLQPDRPFGTLGVCVCESPLEPLLGQCCYSGIGSCVEDGSSELSLAPASRPSLTPEKKNTPKVQGRGGPGVAREVRLVATCRRDRFTFKLKA